MSFRTTTVESRPAAAQRSNPGAASGDSALGSGVDNDYAQTMCGEDSTLLFMLRRLSFED